MSRILVAGITCLDKLKFNNPYEKVSNEIDMSCLNKPNGCLYGSTLLSNQIYPSDWIRWVVSEDFHIDKYKKAISFTLKKKAKIFTIDSPNDYRKLMKDYSANQYKNEPYSRFNRKVINWKLLSNDYDAFHLTEKAFLEMRLPWDIDILKDENGCYMSDFYSYDCETWILFNLDCINEGSILNHTLPNYYKYNH